jgi:hypothetical protein
MKFLLNLVQDKLGRVKRNASPKELMFFDYLEHGESLQAKQKDSSDILQVCHAAFSKEKDINPAVLKKIQGEKPVKGGIHYTSNLIEIIAVGLLDFENEKENILNFYSYSGARDRFLLNMVFPSIEYKRPEVLEDEIDILTQDVLVDNKFDNVEKRLLDAVSATNDLIDLYIIKSVLYCYSQQHPSTEYLEDIKFLSIFYLRLYSTLKFVLRFFLAIVMVSSLFYIFWQIGRIIVPNYDFLEPYLYVLNLAAPTFLTILIIIFDFQITNKKIQNYIFVKFVHTLCSFIFKVIGLNLNKILLITKKVDTQE